MGAGFGSLSFVRTHPLSYAPTSLLTEPQLIVSSGVGSQVRVDIPSTQGPSLNRTSVRCLDSRCRVFLAEYERLTPTTILLGTAWNKATQRTRIFLTLRL
jgi:hypothetical protein